MHIHEHMHPQSASHPRIELLTSGLGFREFRIEGVGFREFREFRVEGLGSLGFSWRLSVVVVPMYSKHSLFGLAARRAFTVPQLLPSVSPEFPASAFPASLCLHMLFYS